MCRIPIARILAAIALVMLTLALIPPEAAIAQDASAPIYASLDELAGKSFAYVNGSVYDKYVQERVPDTTASFYPTLTDAVTAVETGKVDAAVQRSYACQLAVNRRAGSVALMQETVKDMQECYFFPKGSDLRAAFDEQLRRFWDDGTIAALTEKWASADDAAKTLPAQDWDAPNGTLRLATTGQLEPFSYVGEGGMPVGYDVDLALLVCRELGYRLDVQVIGMDGIIASVQSGKADIGGTLTYTDERAQAVDFSESVMPVYVSVIVKAKPVEQASAQQSDGGFLSGIVESFRKTFIVESRWKLLLDGLLVTLMISVCSGALGLVLAFLVVSLQHAGKEGWATKLVGVYHSLFASIPLPVILMLLYYVVFGTIDIAGEAVAIIAFTLSFGASGSATMWTSVRSIGADQEESAAVLGYTRRQTFRRIVFPQAALRFLPQLCAQLTSLVKETSIVGFIAVQDLTRAGDLIRSRTMEAFFPLVAIALIYYVVCRLVTWALDKLASRYQLENRPRTIKGVTL